MCVVVEDLGFCISEICFSDVMVKGCILLIDDFYYFVEIMFNVINNDMEDNILVLFLVG